MFLTPKPLLVETFQENCANLDILIDLRTGERVKETQTRISNQKQKTGVVILGYSHDLEHKQLFRNYFKKNSITTGEDLALKALSIETLVLEVAGIHRPWIPMDIHRYPWIPMHIHGHPLLIH